jgi:hypothetical protein
MQAALPPAPAAEVAQSAPPQPATLAIVSQRTDNVVIASSDRSMVLVKAGHTEQAILRYTLFIVDMTTVLRPSPSPGDTSPGRPPPGPDRMRWSYSPYIQRQLCFTSITGLFSCSAAETIPLGDKSEGETALPPPTASGASATDAQPTVTSAADVALANLSYTLRLGATARFDEDNRLKVDPLLKAAGVRVQRRRVDP